MNGFEFENLNMTELTTEQAKNTSGGDALLMWMIALMWAATPENGSSYWVNDGSGVFERQY